MLSILEVRNSGMLFHTGTDSKIGLTHLGLQVFKATIIIRFSLPKVCPQPFLRLYLMYYSNFFCSVLSTSIFGSFLVAVPLLAIQ